MKFIKIAIENVGGIQDCIVEIPKVSILALAGANGTGKSKFLTCLLLPWGNGFPLPRDSDSKASVEVTITFDDKEVSQLRRYAVEAGWSQDINIPSEMTISVTRQPTSGGLVFTCEQFPVLANALRDNQFLSRVPTMDLIYLPAERRFVAQAGRPVDLNQLSEAIEAQSRTASRSTSLAGQLDDGEFESYGKALCVASALPSEDPAFDRTNASTKWDEFKRAVDVLLYPKFLMPLTQENPVNLRIGLPAGGFHSLDQLSSGERQALVIISRTFRAGEAERCVVIDEPDAYLHPALSSKLLSALRLGLKGNAQLILATHSPAILDSISPDSILRLYHDRAPQLVSTELERLAMYRSAGFRASSLTQSSMLVISEGEFDQHILPLLAPNLASAGIRGVGGRAEVVFHLRSLVAYDLPILGVVDADVNAAAIPGSVDSVCHVWPAADIEGVLLSSDEFLQSALDGALIRAGFRDLGLLKNLLNELLLSMRESSIAESAQRIIRMNDPFDWPSPRGDQAIARLLAAADISPRLPVKIIQEAVNEATEQWNSSTGDLWKMVRGKWILGKFASKVSPVKGTEEFMEAVVARQPQVPAIREFADRAAALMLK